MAVVQDVRNGSDAAPQGSGALGLSALFGLLWRQAWIIALAVALFLGLAAAFLYLTERTYTAAIEILLDPREQRVLTNDAAPTGIGSDVALLESQLTLLQSDTLLRDVIARLKLTEDPEWANNAAIDAYLQTSFGAGKERAEAAGQVALESIRRSVSVRRAERTYVIEVRAQSRDAAKAAQIANTVAEAYIASQSEALRTRSRQANEMLTSRLTALRDDLRNAENKLQDFRQKNGLVGAQGTLVSDQQLQELSLRLIQAQVRAAETRSRAENFTQLARTGGLDATSEALASTALGALKVAVTEARRKEAELSATLGDNHPALIEVREQLRAVSGQVGAEASRIANAARTDAAVAAAQEAALARELANLKTNAQSIDAALIGQRDLERDVQSARQIYETFLNRSKETRERQGIETPSAVIIAPAALTSPTPFPGRSLILGLALIGGLGLGSIVALLRGHLRNPVSGSAQLRALTGAESLWVGDARRGSLLGWRKSGAAAVSAVAASDELGVAARALRNELRDTPLRRGERILACVSPDVPDDAAAVALALAEAVAIGGERVLLIDASPEPSLSSVLNVNGQSGLSEVITGEIALEAAVVHHKERAIWSLGAGNSPGKRNASGSAALTQAVLTAAAQFDYVVILPGSVLRDPDALLLCAAADQIVLTVRENETSANAVQQALRLLGRNRDKLRRVVALTNGRPVAA
jgi:polysaccharide biosynthesis transport protein